MSCDGVHEQVPRANLTTNKLDMKPVVTVIRAKPAVIIALIRSGTVRIHDQPPVC